MTWMNRLPVARVVRVFALVTLVLWLGAIASASAASQAAPGTTPYAVIEVGSKGVRAFVVDLDAARDATCQADDEAHVRCLDLKQLKAINVTPLKEDAIADTVGAVAAHASELKERYRVPHEKIFIVGSSGISRVEHIDRLAVAIEDTVQPAYPMDFVTAEDEAKYAFNGVLGLIPDQYREGVRRHVVVIDIGSGNTKGSFVTDSGDDNQLVAFSVPWGTVSATDQINVNRGPGEFLSAAIDWRDNAFTPELRSEIDRSPGMLDRGSIFLIGGLPWALVTLTEPTNTQAMPAVTAEQITRFAHDASAPEAESRLCSGNPHNTPGSDTERVCKVFSMNNLVAGAFILTTLATEMTFGSEKKDVYFIRDSQFAWPLGYLRNRLDGTNDHP